MVGSWGKGAQPRIIGTVKKYTYPKSSYPKFPQGAVLPSWRTIGLASSWDGKATVCCASPRPALTVHREYLAD